jgi:hypothetical protein
LDAYHQTFNSDEGKFKSQHVLAKEKKSNLENANNSPGLVISVVDFLEVTN